MNTHAGNVIEVANRHFLISEALSLGYLTFVPVYDAGIDLVLYREADRRFFAVQIKTRWTIERKYEGRNIWMAFRDGNDWYLRLHDEMVRTAPGRLKETKSWREQGKYTAEPLSVAMRDDLSSHRFTDVLARHEEGTVSVSESPDDRSPSPSDRLARHRARFGTGAPPLGADGILALRDEGRAS